MRVFLRGLYNGAEWLAMAALALIALLVFAQVVGRVFDSILLLAGQEPYGFLVPSLAEIAGFLLVGASFLALAGSLRGGAQIRVTLAIGLLPPAWRRVVEALVLVLASALAGFFFWYALRLAMDSYRFNELSFGIIAVPLWIPQGFMAMGIGIFALALIDDLVQVVRGRPPSYGEETSAMAEGEIV